MKKISDEGKVMAISAIIMLWCFITSMAGHSELWEVPLFVIAGLLCLHLVISLVRDIYFARRRERLYERRYWEKYKAD